MKRAFFWFVLSVVIPVTGVRAGVVGSETATFHSAAEVLGVAVDEDHAGARATALAWSPPTVELLNGYAGIVRTRPKAEYLRLLQAPEEAVWDDEALDHSA